jgi:hypothetical protein
MPVRSSADKKRSESLRETGSGAGGSRGSESPGDRDKQRTRKAKRGRPRKKKSAKRAAKPAAIVVGEPAPSTSSAAEPTSYAAGFIDGEYQDAGVRGRVFLLGLPNSGKSTLLCGRIRTARRVIVFDPVNAEALKPLIAAGFAHVHQPTELRDGIAKNWGGPFRILYSPTAGSGVEHFEAVNAIVKFAGDCVYAIDEVDKFQEPGYAPPQFYELLNYGRHSHVAMIGTARRPAQVSKEYTYGLSEICAFATTEPGDLDYLEKKIGRAASSQVPGLGKYEYLRWSQAGTATIGKGWK